MWISILEIEKSMTGIIENYASIFASGPLANRFVTSIEEA